MKRFKLFLNEALAHEKIHINPSVEAIKNLAKTSQYKTLRYVLHNDGQLHVGSSEKYLHTDLSKENYDKWHSSGEVNYHHDPKHGDQYEYTAKEPYYGASKYYNNMMKHPVHQKWEKQGIKPWMNVGS